MTKKLFDNPWLTEIESSVLSCTPTSGGFAAVCAETVFFPGGGGQACDTGTLAGLPVLNVFEKDGDIFHIVPEKLPCGGTVLLSADREKRRSDAEIHTGEHILSGLALSLFGAKNVGFHMGAEFATADFAVHLSPGELSRLETEVNLAIREDRPVRISYPDAKELDSLPLRKRPETDEPLRVVEVEGCDLCACCGTHVRSTGEVGLLKVISSEKLRGGTRVAFLCGKRAFDLFQKEHDAISSISRLFSAKTADALDHVKKQGEELSSAKQRIFSLEKQLSRILAHKLFSAAEISENGERGICAEVELGADSLIHVAEALTSLGKCHAFLRSEGRYVLASSEDSDFDLRAENDRLRANGARGGGRGHLFSGSL